MDSTECKRRLDWLIYAAGVNQRYHRILEQRWGWANRALRVVIGVLSVLGIAVAVNPEEHSTAIIVISVLIGIAALALNAIPTVPREKLHAVCYRRWTDLGRSSELLELKLFHQKNDERDLHFIRDQITNLYQNHHTIATSEPTPRRRLLMRCEGDEIESIWGEGIRTAEAADAERAKRMSSVVVPKSATKPPLGMRKNRPSGTDAISD